MTKARFLFQNHRFYCFEISGHAEYADEGLDIVCAGISATVITSLNLLEKILTKKSVCNEDEEKGYIRFEIIDFNISNTDAKFIDMVVENLICSLEQISKVYPKHLQIKIEK